MRCIVPTYCAAEMSNPLSYYASSVGITLCPCMVIFKLELKEKNESKKLLLHTHELRLLNIRTKGEKLECAKNIIMGAFKVAASF